MSTLSQFAGGGVKSVQRGTIVFTSATTAGATITAVDPNKTMLNYLGQNGYYNVTTTNSLDGIGLSRISLTDSTTVTATRYTTSTTGHIVSYEVIEFY